MNESTVKEETRTACRLYNEFMAGTNVGEYSLAILATNLRLLPNGKDIFIEQLEKSASMQIVGKMIGYMNYIEQENYMPTSCWKCKYFHDCNNKGTMIETLKQQNQRKFV